jgi:tetratricopeptide (TPR) repeat protein
LGEAAFERGKGAYRRGDMATTAEELNRFMTMGPSEPEKLEASFYLGAALSQLRKHEQAIPYLERFISGDRRAKTRDAAMLMLTTSYEQSGKPEKAVELARDAIGSYPNSDLVPMLKIRLSSAKRMVAGNNASAAVPAANSATGGSAPVATPESVPSAPAAAKPAPVPPATAKVAAPGVPPTAPAPPPTH